MNCSYVPRLARRDFLRVGGIGIAGYSLMPMLRPLNVEAQESVEPRGGAECCILLMLQGGPSQVDSFDVKEGAWTPQDFDIRTIEPGLRMPVGTLPRLSQRTDKYAIVRSMGAWDLNHNRSIYYLQTGRTFSPARISEVPSVGAVVAYESLNRRRESDFLPPFVSFNVQLENLVGCGMLPPRTSPMNLYSSETQPFILPDHEVDDFVRRRKLLETMDRQWHDVNHQRAGIFSEIADYRQSAYLLSNSQARSIFTMKPEDEERYGTARNGMGHLGYACAMARNMVAADAGAKFVLIQHSSWDLHTNAYDKNESGNQYTLNMELDIALSHLLDDLESMTDQQGRPLIDKTFVGVMGEFGRVGGALDDQKGRNHNIEAGVALFAGAGVQGGRLLGATDESGNKITDPGWHKQRPIYPEDVLATIYSVMGIDGSKRITQTPSGRAFDYIEYISPKGPMDFGEISDMFA